LSVDVRHLLKNETGEERNSHTRCFRNSSSGFKVLQIKV
jgi:hypothetical protein